MAFQPRDFEPDQRKEIIMAEARNVVLVHGGFGKNSRFDTLATRTVAFAFALAFVVGACDAYAQGAAGAAAT